MCKAKTVRDPVILKRMMNLIMKLVRRIRRKLRVVCLQSHFLCDRGRNKKVVVFYVGNSGQVVYVAPVIRELVKRRNISCYLAYGNGLTGKERTVSCIPQNKIINVQDCRNVKGIDAFVSPDQWEGGSSSVHLRICMFHGQPSKGNTFLPQNIQSFNALFLLGPLQRSLYEEFSHAHPDIARNIRALNIGCPKIDSQLRCAIDRESVLNELGLNSSYKTVIYAPAFDPGCSLRTYGTDVVKRLLDVPEINVIVKLHPATIEPLHSPNYVFYTGGIDWAERIRTLERENARLRYIEEADTSLYFGACDVMVTDFSGVAMEFMLLDRPVVYIDCPEFFENTCPKYGSDPVLVKKDDRYNAGRNYGVVVDGLAEMLIAVKRSLNNHKELSAKRKEFTKLLLYNPGCSDTIATDAICSLLAEASQNL